MEILNPFITICWLDKEIQENANTFIFKGFRVFVETLFATQNLDIKLDRKYSEKILTRLVHFWKLYWNKN